MAGELEFCGKKCPLRGIDIGIAWALLCGQLELIDRKNPA